MIQAVKLSDQVRQQLLKEILGGQLAPGTVLNEVELAGRLGVSRTPVREALRHLAEHGLVEDRANHSAQVRRLGPERLRETYQVREALEGMAAELACGSLTPEDFVRLDELVAAVADANDARSFDACHRLDVELHRLIARRSGNAMLAREIERFHDLVQLVRACVAEQPGAVALAFRQHRQIIQALRARRPAQARQAMVNHIRASCAVAVRSAAVAAGALPTKPAAKGGTR
jgi:DNA-binding GntR family transcriptional regulator